MIAHLMKILLVEDDKLLNHHLATLLTEAQNQVHSTDNAQVALHYATDYPIDVAIIDLGLPDMDGLQLIRQLRERQIPFPIIVLTARGNWQDKVEGLEAGADDYLVKPFQKDELLARLNALVRRSAGFISPRVKAGDYELDLSRKELTIGGEPVVLTSFEYLILEYLMRNARQVVSKQQLLDQLYGDGEGDPNTIEVMVSRLRKKLDPGGEHTAHLHHPAPGLHLQPLVQLMGLRLLSRPMQLLQRSLHIKLMLSAMLVIALIMAFSVYILYLGHTEEQAQKASTRMQENLSKLFSSKLPEPHSTTDLGKITPDAIDPNLDTLICRADGQLSWSSLHMPEVVQARDTICQDLMNYLGGLDQDYFFKRHTIKNGESYFIYSLRFLRNHGDGPTTYYVVMVDSAKRYLAQTRNYLCQCIRQALLAYSLLGALLLLTSFWSLTSLRTMARQIDEIRAGKREALSNDYERELTPLTESVNQLLENERQQSQRYQHALNDLAHSLKTRLALIQITAQEVKLGHDIHDNINEQILTMDQIIQYQLRRAVTGRQRLASKGTEPVPLIEKLLASLAKVYRHKKLQTRFKFDDDVFFAGEQGDLMELMGNLLDNAFKFAISEIQVTVSRRLDRLRIEIEDDGPGIDPDRSQQIFQRGVRADSSPGQGIGLAVVTEIVHSYGGQIMVDESPLGGARFTLDLP